MIKQYFDFIDIIYSPCIYFLYIFHATYLIEFILVAYLKYNKIHTAKFIYYKYQYDMGMSRFLLMRLGIWTALLYLDTSEQGQSAIAYTCEPAFTPSVFMILSIGYCIKMVIGNRNSAENERTPE